jgi:hypothetical protein
MRLAAVLLDDGDQLRFNSSSLKATLTANDQFDGVGLVAHRLALGTSVSLLLERNRGVYLGIRGVEPGAGVVAAHAGDSAARRCRGRAHEQVRVGRGKWDWTERCAARSRRSCRTLIRGDCGAPVLRQWLQTGALVEHYRDPDRRSQLKPEALWEVEHGLALSAQQVYEVLLVRSA